ncbi:hypothetical protein PENTCL1PPCAC_4729, partial [Pristionchus entomophagus]
QISSMSGLNKITFCLRPTRNVRCHLISLLVAAHLTDVFIGVVASFRCLPASDSPCAQFSSASLSSIRCLPALDSRCTPLSHLRAHPCSSHHCFHRRRWLNPMSTCDRLAMCAVFIGVAGLNPIDSPCAQLSSASLASTWLWLNPQCTASSFPCSSRLISLLV